MESVLIHPVALAYCDDDNLRKICETSKEARSRAIPYFLVVVFAPAARRAARREALCDDA